jgi:hypothetical protein
MDSSIRSLIEQITSAQDWTDGLGGKILLAGHSAQVVMGSFSDPLEDGLAGMTLSQWQFETAKRMVLGALAAYIATSPSDP